MVDTGILSNNMKFPLTSVKWHSVAWQYIMTTLYLSDLIQKCDHITEPDILPNAIRHLRRCGMPTGDAHSAGHLVPSHLGLAYVLFVWTNPVQNCTGLCMAPMYLHDFAFVMNLSYTVVIYMHKPYIINRCRDVKQHTLQVNAHACICIGSVDLWGTGNPREGPGGGLSRECAPPYPQRDRKRRLNGAVCRNHRIKRLVPCRC